ncbi:MAG: beta-ketoacyl synthase N-terminal-like domain-containing protein, partial [Candidatus Binatia bacterium]
MKDAVIVSTVRTPIGSLNGSLNSLSAPTLGSIVIAEALGRAGVDGFAVDEVIMGNVLSAGVGQGPARQTALKAGLPDKVGCTTINKVCGSGLKAVMLGAQAIRLGEAEVVVAGGMESMSNAPYLLDKARSGYRLGNATMMDSLFKDGLCDAGSDLPMGALAESCAEEFHISRADQDEFAATSYRRAQAAQRAGA